MRPYDEYRQFTPNPEGVARSNATLFDNRQQKNSECQRWQRGGRADVWLTVFYFDKVSVKLAMLELMRVCVCARVCTRVCVRVRAHACCDHFNCFLIPAESTLNTYCRLNNHCIKVCFYLWKQNGFYIHTHTHVGFCGLRGLSIGVMVFNCMCYCPTPTLHLNLALTGDCVHL